MFRSTGAVVHIAYWTYDVPKSMFEFMKILFDKDRYCEMQIMPIGSRDVTRNFKWVELWVLHKILYSLDAEVYPEGLVKQCAEE